MSISIKIKCFWYYIRYSTFKLVLRIEKAFFEYHRSRIEYELMITHYTGMEFSISFA